MPTNLTCSPGGVNRLLRLTPPNAGGYSLGMANIAVSQFTPTANLDQNLDVIARHVAEAAASGARLVAFPEMAYFMGRPSEWLPLLGRYSEFMERFAALASQHSLYLCPGTLREPVAGRDGRYHNTAVVFGPDGKLLGRYRKSHLFDAQIQGKAYEESKYCDAGTEVVTVETELGVVGLAICYDLRFPDLFQALKKKGARFVLLPSAFTVPTGKAHWEILVRARAIENKFCMVAPGAVGLTGEGNATWGQSLIITTDGAVVVDAGEGTGVFVGEG